MGHDVIFIFTFDRSSPLTVLPKYNCAGFKKVYACYVSVPFTWSNPKRVARKLLVAWI